MGPAYWLASTDGGVFTFGDGAFGGSLAGHDLNAPIVGIAATPTGDGYWLAAADGGVFAFGDATFAGSITRHHLNAPIVGITRTWDGDGYWLAGRDGGVFGFGDAGFLGSRASRSRQPQISAVIAALAPTRPPEAPTLGGVQGYDVSWPQCDAPYPTADVNFGIVGLTGGKAFTSNPCLDHELQWSRADGGAAGLYLNINAPDATDVSDPSYPVRTGRGPRGGCAAADTGCRMASYGAAAADAAWSIAAAHGASAPLWWLDVETANTWLADLGLNRRIVLGAIHALRRHGVSVGLYSTAHQWDSITGGLRIGLPVWVAGASDPGAAVSWCDGRGSFNGGQTWLVQALPSAYDNDVACGPILASATGAFTMEPLPQAPVVERGAAAPRGAQ
jgi:hypothetical protein